MKNRTGWHFNRWMMGGLVVAAGWFLVACGPTGPATESGQTGEESANRIQVVTTVGMIQDIARQVAGPHAEIRGLIGEGVDPHLYKPTAGDVKQLQSADLILYNGLMLEGKMSDILVRLASRGKPVHAVSALLESDTSYVLQDEAQHLDPHVWMDVSGWMKAVRVVETALSETLPAHATDFQAARDAYLAELKELDAYARRCLESIPEDRRVLVTAHDAFQYMARAYGLTVRGIQGLSTESEAGVRDIEDLVAFLVERRIPAVFVESSVSDKNVRALLEGTRAAGHEVRIGGELFSDAMGPAGSYEGTYIGMMDHNITTITRALGGEAPEKGWKGRLGGPAEAEKQP